MMRICCIHSTRYVVVEFGDEQMGCGCVFLGIRDETSSRSLRFCTQGMEDIFISMIVENERCKIGENEQSRGTPEGTYLLEKTLLED